MLDTFYPVCIFFNLNKASNDKKKQAISRVIVFCMFIKLQWLICSFINLFILTALRLSVL